jgi:hypothetical protein
MSAASLLRLALGRHPSPRPRHRGEQAPLGCLQRSAYLGGLVNLPRIAAPDLAGQESVMNSELIDAIVRRAADTTPRRALFGLLALAAGSFVVPLAHSDTQARGKKKHKNKHHNRKNNGARGHCTFREVGDCLEVCCEDRPCQRFCARA